MHVVELDGSAGQGGAGDSSRRRRRRRRTSGSAASSAWMPAAADCPTMPWCSTARRSRSGRNTSVPAISTISSASIVICPSETRHTPSASAAAAPIAMPPSVMPRVITLVDSTRIVVRTVARARVGEAPAVGRALAERLQGRQALHRVEEFRAEGLVGRPWARLAPSRP